MKPDGTMEWFELLHEYFGVYMTESRAKMWLVELRQSTQAGGTGPGTTEDELCQAIRFYRSKTGKGTGDEGRRKKETTLDDLIMWVRWMRKDARDRRGAPGDSDGTCGICEDGWVTAWRNLPADNLDMDSYFDAAEPCQVPCICDRGRHWMQTCKDYKDIADADRQALTRLAQLGARQETERRRLFANERRRLEQLQEAPR
jgi:hypothetical protein